MLLLSVLSSLLVVVVVIVLLSLLSLVVVVVVVRLELLVARDGARLRLGAVRDHEGLPNSNTIANCVLGLNVCNHDTKQSMSRQLFNITYSTTIDHEGLGPGGAVRLEDLDVIPYGIRCNICV